MAALRYALPSTEIPIKIVVAYGFWVLANGVNGWMQPKRTAPAMAINQHAYGIYDVLWLMDVGQWR